MECITLLGGHNMEPNATTYGHLKWTALTALIIGGRMILQITMCIFVRVACGYEK
jgi:hypothetical protein